MTYATSKKCRKCGETLDLDARKCGACGLSVDSSRGRQSAGLDWDHVCQWAYGSLRCKYPVGFFELGAHKGLCIFHRQIDKGHQAAEIANDSQQATREEYLTAANRLVNGTGDNPEVARLRAQLRVRASGGNVGILSSRILPNREPGEDGNEYSTWEVAK